MYLPGGAMPKTATRDPSRIAQGHLGLAAEFAVASELCRRGIYAQLTLGHQKRTDLLAFSEGGRLTRIEVKAKQGREWPNCRGIYGENIFLVFVDYQHLPTDQRPAFYILDSDDWRRVLKRRVAEIKKRNPGKRIEIDRQNVATFVDEIQKSGHPYRGMGIRAADLTAYAEQWTKVLEAVGVQGQHP